MDVRYHVGLIVNQTPQLRKHVVYGLIATFKDYTNSIMTTLLKMSLITYLIKKERKACMPLTENWQVYETICTLSVL